MSKMIFMDCEFYGDSPQTIRSICLKYNEHILHIPAIKLLEGVEPDNETLEFLGINEGDLNEGVSYTEAYHKINCFLSAFVDRYDYEDKFVVCGYGLQRDMEALRSMWQYMGNEHLFALIYPITLDVQTLVCMARLDGTIPGGVGYNSLECIYNYVYYAYDIKPFEGKFHNEKDDVIAIEELYNFFTLSKVEQSASMKRRDMKTPLDYLEFDIDEGYLYRDNEYICLADIDPKKDCCGVDFGKDVYIGRYQDLSEAPLKENSLGGLAKEFKKIGKECRLIFDGYDWEGADLREANLKHTDFDRCNLNYADLSGASLKGGRIFLYQNFDINIDGAYLSKENAKWGVAYSHFDYLYIDGVRTSKKELLK